MKPQVVSLLAALAFGAGTGGVAAPTQPLVVASPNHAVIFRLLESAGNPQAYAASLGRKPVIKPSPLRFTLDGCDITTDIKRVNVRRYAIDVKRLSLRNSPILESLAPQ